MLKGRGGVTGKRDSIKVWKVMRGGEILFLFNLVSNPLCGTQPVWAGPHP